MDAHRDNYEGPELDEAVAERIADMSYAELRNECDSFRAYKRIGLASAIDRRFSEWLRDRTATAIRMREAYY